MNKGKTLILGELQPTNITRNKDSSATLNAENIVVCEKNIQTMGNQSGRYVDNGKSNLDDRGQNHIFPVQYTHEEHVGAAATHEFTYGLDSESYPFAPGNIDKNTYPKELQYSSLLNSFRSPLVIS